MPLFSPSLPDASPVVDPETAGNRLRAVILTALAIAAAMLTAPTAASACVSLSSLKSFTGSAGEVGYDDIVQGTWSGGTKTIGIGLGDTNLKLNVVQRKSNVSWAKIFTGRPSGGNFIVNDSVSYTEAGAPAGSASEQAGGPPDLTTVADAAVLFDLKHCKYVIDVAAGIHTNYTGPDGLKPPFGEVSFGANSAERKIPSSLHLKGSESLPAKASGCQGPTDFATEQFKPCYTFSGDWANDFYTLALCNSVTTESCAPNDTPISTADFIWDLKPKFKK